MTRKRILLVASAGGHWVQLCRLSKAFEGHEVQYVTTMKGAIAPNSDRPVAIVPDASRNDVFKLLILLVRLVVLIARYRPHVLVTTGAAPGLLALQVGGLLGARTVWIDSVANSEELSLSGKLAGRVASLWLTQWKHLSGTAPGLTYMGCVL
ncbi:UDP-N-acetylglucosamine--LPS N-acetylglucosamine transferase [Sphingomonas sp. ID0503]|uniref:UDP-N-acetylglucosamine--LPS N-acetylglucosamine transferase n=1 Tax=Sphingomonas sp. ID0503 TaxID=3399691 RepID=UPI003AFAAB04